MTIEFHTPAGKVIEKLISSIRNDMLELLHINKKITRAEVMMKEDTGIFDKDNKVCEIRLSIFGDNLYTRSRTESFENSAKQAVKDLKRLVRQQVKKENATTHTVMSSVKR
ncbi:MAG: hypothetical protein WAU23_12370 [Ferruginibacter sp.]